MQVKLYASLRQAAGEKLVEIDFNPSLTVRDLLVELTRRYPALEKLVWKEPGMLSEYVHLFINGENFHHLAGLDTRLEENDHVDIFPPLVGGSLGGC